VNRPGLTSPRTALHHHLRTATRLCELNVLRQVFHVATSPVVASAWSEGQEVHLYGLIYDLSDGHLRKLAGPISGDDGEREGGCVRA
jgi:carbonic anhydrase